MNYDALRRQHATNQAAAIAARVDHSWIRNSVRCAFERHFTAGNTKGEPWENTHILHSYGINRYGYLVTDLQPPAYP